MSDVTYAAQGVTFENFDPNKQFANKPLWGVFDGFKFKTYSQRGHAVNAVHHHNQVKLYEQTAEGWVLRAEKNWYNKPTCCDHCGGSTMGHRKYTRWDYSVSPSRRVAETDPEKSNLGDYVFKRRGRRLVEPVTLLFCCPACVPVVSP